jgi:hypothetical protein
LVALAAEDSKPWLAFQNARHVSFAPMCPDCEHGVGDVVSVELERLSTGIDQLSILSTPEGPLLLGIPVYDAKAGPVPRGVRVFAPPSYVGRTIADLEASAIIAWRTSSSNLALALDSKLKLAHLLRLDDDGTVIERATVRIKWNVVRIGSADPQPDATGVFLGRRQVDNPQQHEVVAYDGFSAVILRLSEAPLSAEVTNQSILTERKDLAW